MDCRTPADSLQPYSLRRNLVGCMRERSGELAIVLTRGSILFFSLPNPITFKLFVIWGAVFAVISLHAHPAFRAQSRSRSPWFPYSLLAPAMFISMTA